MADLGLRSELISAGKDDSKRFNGSRIPFKRPYSDDGDLVLK
jgi:hypothetical protein